MKMPTLGILNKVDESILSTIKDKKQRDYLGCSSLGDECERKIWYGYRQRKPVDNPRVQRIFDMGNVIEDYLISLLKKVDGISIFEKDDDGNQYGVEFLNGRVKGHIDGVIVGLPESKEPHLLEIKSMKNSVFNQYKKKGLKANSDTYHGQMQLYMGGLNLSNGLFIAMNKDNQELYVERVKFCEFEFKVLKAKAESILNSNTPPIKAYGKPETFFKCKMCNHREECMSYGE